VHEAELDPDLVHRQGEALGVGAQRVRVEERLVGARGRRRRAGLLDRPREPRCGRHGGNGGQAEAGLLAASERRGGGRERAASGAHRLRARLRRGQVALICAARGQTTSTEEV
jgi:hypothetical protein